MFKFVISRKYHMRSMKQKTLHILQIWWDFCKIFEKNSKAMKAVHFFKWFSLQDWHKLSPLWSIFHNNLVRFCIWTYLLCWVPVVDIYNLLITTKFRHTERIVTSVHYEIMYSLCSIVGNPHTEFYILLGLLWRNKIISKFEWVSSGILSGRWFFLGLKFVSTWHVITAEFTVLLLQIFNKSLKTAPYSRIKL